MTISAYLALIKPPDYFPVPTREYFQIVILGSFLWLVITSSFSYYKDKRTHSFSQSLFQFTGQWVLVSFLIFAYLVLSKSDISRLSLVLFLIYGYILLLLSNRVRLSFLNRIRRRGLNQRLLVFVGTKEQRQTIEQYLTVNPGFGYRLLDTAEINYKGTMANPIKTLTSILENQMVDDVMVGTFSHRNKIMAQLVNIAEDHGCRVRIIKLKEDVYTRQIGLVPFGPFKVIAVREEPLSVLPARIFKRLFDIIFSLTFLITIYWWLYLIIAMLIKVSSKGPVFFNQKRVGRKGQHFYCYKFRSMAPNNSTSEGEGEITSASDARITWIGAILRKTNLDEIPQFVNVLKGDMSVIGPRPHMVTEDIMVAQKLVKYRIRRFIRPGISGWAAVNGYRGGTEDMSLMQKRVDYDIEYIETWTPLLDLKIIYETCRQMITGNTGVH